MDELTSFSTVFQSYQDDGQVMIKDCVIELGLQSKISSS